MARVAGGHVGCHGQREVSRLIGGTRRTVLGLQAGYYLATGIWPLLHRRSFEAVTGPKADFWLVQTVGVCVGAIGVGLALAVRRGALAREMRATSLIAAAGLGAAETVFVHRRRISRVYLLDAAAQAVFVAALSKRSARPGPSGRDVDAV